MDDMSELSKLYWRNIPDEELVGRDNDERMAILASHVELASQRPSGQLNLRILPASTPESPQTVQIVTDDMPFLVDSVLAELNKIQAHVRLLVHPQYVVRRDNDGKLLEVLAAADPEAPGTGELAESWIHIEIDPVLDPPQVERQLRRILGDVRLAVEDWGKMRAKALAIADELSGADLPVPDKDITDTQGLLRWLVEDHFTFVGSRDYRLIHDGNESYLQAIEGTGLGVLRGSEERDKARDTVLLPQEVRTMIKEQRLLITTKANSRSTVHRPSFLDYIGIKTFDSAGNVIGERRFIGLFSSSAYFQSVRKLPVVSRKVEEVISRSGLSLASFSGKDLLSILETYPRDELFQVTTNELFDTSMAIMRLSSSRKLRVFVRHDGYGRFITCMAYMPRDRYNTRTRIVMQDVLMRELDGEGIDYTARVSESNLARLRFVVRLNEESFAHKTDVHALEAHLQDALTKATRMWEEDFADALETQFGVEDTRRLMEKYAYAFTPSYKAEHDAALAVDDIVRLEQLSEQTPLLAHMDFSPKDTKSLTFTIYTHGDEAPLAHVLPVLQSLGMQVLAEHPYDVTDGDRKYWIYRYGLSLADGVAPPANREEVARALEDAFVACWQGEAVGDIFNELVLAARLNWDQIVILRAYARYLRQIGIVYTNSHIQRTIVKYPAVACRLIGLFEARHNPHFHGNAQASAEEHREEIERALETVPSLDEDFILRSYLSLIMATLRTNHYQREEDGSRKPSLALKLAPRQIDNVPEPRPSFEIFVYSPRLEAIHLRFGMVARGGLRWSDRREDFRTEVLGLVKAQEVKNAIIVPAGAKGGFVLKKPPVSGDRAALQEEGIACYKIFISALLDVTDNLVSGTVVPPVDVIRHDGDDPYLVVAADKGTATFSDIANQISLDRGFWLGDAFASGGSHGYDHKAMGITARGAWESVKRHFRQMNKDIQQEDFTVVGIGDMSGDVFGNGMLLSGHIRLVAAFDHRHIFLDPNPDASISFKERQRLFALPGSSWASYDPALLSPGGGVWEKTVKSIPLSTEAQQALGVQVDSLTPAELTSAILRAPVDLLWNGGIGTFVKATNESHAEAGDKANDTVRINASELRCSVVGEGGNLGFTQRARVEFALAGGHVITDAIDNSAGVDTSDHEVNMKILLSQAIDAGQLTLDERNTQLQQETDEVAELVVRDNYTQNVALMTAGYLAPKLISVHRRLLDSLEKEGKLNRALEYLPDDEACVAREKEGRGFVEPELAVLLAYVKKDFKEQLLASSLLDEEWCEEVLAGYFPSRLRSEYAGYLGTHPLKRQIVATLLTNNMVDHGGVSFAHRALEETGAHPTDLVRAYVVVRELFDLPRLWTEIEALDNKVSTQAQLAAGTRLRRVLDRGVRWLLQSRSGTIDVRAEIDRLRGGMTELLPRVDELYVGAEAQTIARLIDELANKGLPRELASSVVAAVQGFGLLDVVELATARGMDALMVARLYFTVSARFSMDALLEKVTELPRHDRWTTLARMAARYDLYSVLAGITAEVLDRAGGRVSTESPSTLLDEWIEANKVRIDRVERTLTMVNADPDTSLAALSVLLRQLRSLPSA